MRLAFLPVVVLLSTPVLAGCATGASRAEARAPSTVSNTGGTAESTDRRLAAALLVEQLSPSAEAHLHVGREYARLGILDFAHTRVERALSLEPRLPAAHEMMARIWRDWGQPDAGLVHAYRAIHYAPGSAGPQNTLGTLLDALGRVEEARVAYGRAVAFDPGAGWALSNLCYLEFRQGRFDEARRQCEAALRAMPLLTEAHNNLALAHAGSGDLAGAEEAFLAAGDVAAAHYNLGIVHLASGRFDEAGREFQTAMDARPEFTAAKTRAHESRMRALGAYDRKYP